MIRHILSIAFALLLTVLLLAILSVLKQNEEQQQKVISYQQSLHRGVLENLGRSEQLESEFMASLKLPEQVTMFGSSEFGSSPYSSYYFLPDSMGIPVLAVGHAQHQCLSILCELLAGKEFLKGSKICIILSPSWFHTPGTNSEAFVEFVRPNFLKKIRQDTAIAMKYKLAIGEFIFRNREEFSGINRNMHYFIDTYLQQESVGPQAWKSRLRQTVYDIHENRLSDSLVTYRPLTGTFSGNRSPIRDKREYLKALQQKFLASITNNEIYVDDKYYSTYVLDSLNHVRTDSIRELNWENNHEFNDFMLLVDLLNETGADASFVIQPMNPYYYLYVERNRELIDKITGRLEACGMPYLNLYAYSKETYEPGVLKDVMHLGDAGWMKINFFLDSLYENHR